MALTNSKIVAAPVVLAAKNQGAGIDAFCETNCVITPATPHETEAKPASASPLAVLLIPLILLNIIKAPLFFTR